jgi:hypothetical protein
MWLNRLLALEVKSHGSWLLVDWSGPIVGWAKCGLATYVYILRERLHYCYKMASSLPRLHETRPTFTLARSVDQCYG